MLARRDELLLGAAVEQVVRVLRGHEALRADRLCCTVGVHDLPRGEVRRADVPDLPFAHDVVQRRQRLLDRGGVVGGVHLQQVDPVGPQSPQRPVDRPSDGVAGAARLPGRCVDPAARVTELGRHHRLLATAGEGTTEQLLALPRGAAVQLGAVEQGDPRLQGRVHDR